MRELLRRLHYLIHRRRLDDELASDLEFHREMAAREGRPFGNTLYLREESRDAWGWTWIDRFLQDLRYALRLLVKSPGFTVSAVLMLAIGIGMNVAAFGFLNMVFLRALPVKDPDSLLRIMRRAPNRYASALPFPEISFFREHASQFSAVLAATDAKLGIEGEAKPLSATFVTPNFHRELGAAVRLGRSLDASRDSGPDAEAAVVLGHGFWQRHFGADPAVVGRMIHLNGKPATIVGVAAREFSGLGFDSPDVWIAMDRHPYFVPGSRLLTDFAAEAGGAMMWARLKPGVTPRAAEEELRALAAELHRQQPDVTWENESPMSQPGGYVQPGGGYSGSSPRKSLREEMLPYFAIVGLLVLLILAVACSNLGSLLLARGVARQREIAIRVAVGAGNGRLIRQLFTESLALAGLGSAAGLALGWAVLRILLVFIEAPEWLDPSPDWRVVLFAGGTGLGSALLFGLAPALQLARQRHRATFMRQVLVGVQVAASCVLLIVAGLLVRSFQHVLSVDLGFEYQRVIAIDPDLSQHGYTPATARAYLDTLANRLRGIPGVESVALTATSPLGTRNVIGARFTVADKPVDVSVNRVEPGYLETMKIPIVRGRDLARGDAHAIVVSEALAHRLWPAENPLGKSLTVDGDLTVVGVTRNARVVAIKDADSVEMYQLPGAVDLPKMVVLVRTAAAPETVLAPVAAMARAMDGKVSPDVKMLKTQLRERLQDTERGALAVSVLGLTALLIACLGIVGLVAYAVSQRAKEIGIRMALGADTSQVLWVVLQQFARPVGAGLLGGIAAAAAFSTLLRRELYGLDSHDPVSYLTAVAVFAVTAAIAGIVPARRALRMDPMRTLRQD